MVGNRLFSSSLFKSLDAGGLRMLASMIFHLPSFVKLYMRLLGDSRVPTWRKVLFLLGLLYFFWPIDFLRDTILPPLGFVDDAIVFVFSLKWFIQNCPKDVVAEHIQAISEKK